MTRREMLLATVTTFAAGKLLEATQVQEESDDSLVFQTIDRDLSPGDTVVRWKVVTITDDDDTTEDYPFVGRYCDSPVPDDITLYEVVQADSNLAEVRVLRLPS